MYNDMPVVDVYAQEVLDSRGIPAAKIEVMTEDGSIGRVVLPQGAPGCRCGANASTELGACSGEQGLSDVCHFVNSVLAGELIGENVYEQAAIDRILSHHGGGYGVSLALAAAAAKTCNQPLYRYLGGMIACCLPSPMMGILTRGNHAAEAMDFQEILIMPVRMRLLGQGLRMCVRVYEETENILRERKLSAVVGENGGFLPALADAGEALALVTEAIERAGGHPGEDVVLGINAAAGRMYEKSLDCYVFAGESAASGREIRRSREEMIAYLEELCQTYPIRVLEDALEENDWDGWSKLTEHLGGRVELVGGDLFHTDRKRLAQGIRSGAGNAIRLNAGEAGTLTDVLALAELARKNGYRTVVSCCPRETEDTFAADLAVAVGAVQFQGGAPHGAEWTAKYNRLLCIEDSLGLAASCENQFR
ncbi:MAG: phosphopyruvate hydratase [Lachnospiraceae bacterium]|nr:phosphopyruvate hydratase [Lachnospiraceae bacterium]